MRKFALVLTSATIGSASTLTCDPSTDSIRPIWQVFQPLQLFAQAYHQFDHYWNLELDVRFTSYTLPYLEAVSQFARNEPRKQAWERASFRYIPAVHGTYNDFISAVNNSVEGQGLWHPPQIPEINNPVGPRPPVPEAINDDFQWGIGEDADFIPMVPCSKVSSEPRWFGYSYIFGFKHGMDTPRFFCPQAVGRASWTLLNAIHIAQVEKGVKIPSEATLPSFAYWHGLKISSPPQPWFINPPQTAPHMNEVLNGGLPRTEWRGFANGTATWNDTVFGEFNDMHPSYRWGTLLPGEIMDTWLDQDIDAEGDLPYLLVKSDGKTYAPSMVLHPVKTRPDLRRDQSWG